MIGYYVPFINHIKFVPTIILICLFGIYLIDTSNKKDYFPALLVFLLINVISGYLAFFTGPPRSAIRGLAECYVLGILTITYLKDKKWINTLFLLFLFQFIYYAFWGILGKGIVPWDYILNEQDAFGPMMTMGFVFAYFFPKEILARKYTLTIALICIMGIVVSFARGSFLSLVGLLFIIFLKSKYKLRMAVSIVGIASIVTITAVSFFPSGVYLKEMKSSYKGFEDSTGSDRWVLWQIAWLEFLDYPILGVGPQNFGNMAIKYRDKITFKKDELYADPNQLWGRALHNVYLELLSEIGLLGFLSFFFLIYGYYKSGKRDNIKHENNYDVVDPGERPIEPDNVFLSYRTSMSLSIIAYLINAVFYQMLYIDWLFYILIMNRVLILSNNKGNER